MVFSLCLSYSTWNFEIELVLILRSGEHLQEESHPRTPWYYLPDYKKETSKIESLYPSHGYPDANSGSVSDHERALLPTCRPTTDLVL